MTKRPRVWAIRTSDGDIALCAGREPSLDTASPTMVDETKTRIEAYLGGRHVKRLTGYSLAKVGVAEEIEITIRPKCARWEKP